MRDEEGFVRSSTTASVECHFVRDSLNDTKLCILFVVHSSNDFNHLVTCALVTSQPER